MRRFFVIFVFCYFTANAPARAASIVYDFIFSGFIETSISNANSGSRDTGLLVGQTISAFVSIVQTDNGTFGSASVGTDLSSLTFRRPSILSTSGESYSGLTSFSTNSQGLFSGSIGSGFGSFFTFSYSSSNPSLDVVTAPILVQSINRPGDSGSLNLTFHDSGASLSSSSFPGAPPSPVPLPPALPLFASALAALGFVALRQRRSTVIRSPAFIES